MTNILSFKFNLQKLISLFLLCILSLSLVLGGVSALAQDNDGGSNDGIEGLLPNRDNICKGGSSDNVCLTNKSDDGEGEITALASGIGRIMLYVAGVIALPLIAWAGLQFVLPTSSDGDKKSAITLMQNVAIGLVILVLSFTIVTAFIALLGNLGKYFGTS